MKIGFAAPLTVGELLPWLDNVGDEGLPVGLGGPSTTALLRGLLERGSDVVAVTLDPGVTEPVTMYGERLVLHIGPYRPRHRAGDAFKVERHFVAGALAKSSVDVIGAHWSYEFALGALATGIPTVIGVHDWAPTILRHMPARAAPYYIVRLGMHAAAVARGEHFIAVSPYIAARIERWRRTSVPIVPNPVEDYLFEVEHDRLHTEAPVIVSVNNGFNRLKNVQALMEAYSIVRRRMPGARLVLAGYGFEPAGAAHAWATRRGLALGVEFVGSLAPVEARQLIRSADLLVHPSREESFGLTLVEAMAQGTPVIGGRDSGAVPWVLAEGRAGELVDVRDPEALADATMRLVSDTDLWSERSTRGRALTHERFSASVVVPSYEDELIRVAGDARDRSERGLR